MDSGAAERLGLRGEFDPRHARRGQSDAAGPPPRPFPGEVARALADKENLARLADSDTLDLGMRDIWEATVITGR